MGWWVAFVSYLLARTGMDYVFRASNARLGARKRDLWHRLNSLIHSPVI